ncbi:DNA polymerase III subunit beta [Lamprobacter modestohalophilus]|uniref:DNA polymerase III subunit beta n=1 Tax=Lamprobacter modestohalophilus TaxID=1064514 RepID=UPI002ADED942|nr:DNA polymerase III subunit beta [Lamprobacter modestohalophilus]MEA1052586.1 DNA polymerase III subunit beta [Lamprobacter modestohalophilus]
MKISVDRSVLLPALSVVGGVVERRQTLPILGNLLLSADDGLLRLKGTDLEIEITSTAVCEVEEAGTATLPARKLTDIARSLPDGTQALIKVQSERGTVVSGRSRFTLSTLPAADFPTMEVPAPEVMVEVDRDVLQRLLDKTSFAMAQQDVRYYLNGVLLELSSDRAVAVATDGHRLAKVVATLDDANPDDSGLATEPRQVIVPAKTVLELKRLLGSAPDRVRVELSERALKVDLGKTQVVSKLVEGQYPDYNRVIPADLERVASIDRDRLRAALQRTAILSNEKYKGVRVTFETGRLLLQTQNPEKEQAEDEIEIEYSGESVSVGFNVAYVLDVLSAVDASTVEVRFKNAENSAVWQGVGAEDEVFVIMPMRL